MKFCPVFRTHYTIHVEDVIKGDSIETYISERRAIRDRLSNAANNIFILEKIADFPFHLFAPSSENQHFWKATFNALMKDTIQALWHVNSDVSKHVADSGELRLSRFENKLRRDWIRDDIDEQVEAELSRRLKDNKENKQLIGKLAEKINKIRNEIVAHIDYTASQRQVMSQEHKITIDELKNLLTYCGKWFQILCLDMYFTLNVWDYHEGNKWTDIDEILCLVASNSIYFKSFSQDWLMDAQREDINELS